MCTLLKLDVIQGFLNGSNIIVRDFLDNNKASESYIRTTFIQDDGFTFTTIVPYRYRRTGLDLRSEKDIAEYLKEVKKYFTKEWIESWVKKEKAECEADIQKKEESNKDKISRGKKPTEIVTPYFLLALLTLEETTSDKLPVNSNPQRRLQDLKDSGYTIPIVQYGDKTTSTLLPFPNYAEMGYEKGFTKQFKARVIRLLKSRNAFEAKVTHAKALIPDHKFPEVRWDEDTKAENTMDMSDEDIVRKFQLLDNQRNLQKREVCRKCFQERKRGAIYGIEYFYDGDENWNPDIPEKGESAEKGCEGCPWYDIERWREMLNKHIGSTKK